MSVLKLLASTLFYVLSIVVIFCLMLPFMVLKLLPILSLRVLCSRALMAMADAWCVCSQWWIDLVNPVHWRVQLPEGLERQNWYLVIANHQSWVDILVLQKVFTNRIPFLKFFLKQQLFYIPLLGIVWWALDFPSCAAAVVKIPKKIWQQPAPLAKNFALCPRRSSALLKARALPPTNTAKANHPIPICCPPRQQALRSRSKPWAAPLPACWT